MPKEFFLTVIFPSILLLFSVTLNAAEEADWSNKGFPEKINEAYQAALKGEYGKSFDLFEKLLASNSKEFIVYDLYAQALERDGKFKKAISVYERWQYGSENLSPKESELISSKIEALQRRIKFFEQDIALIKPWHQATGYHVGHFKIKTNIPKKYHEEVLGHIREITERETEMLRPLFGNTISFDEEVRVFIVSSRSIYDQVVFKELERQRPPTWPHPFYSPQKRAIVVLFEGVLQLPSLAHEIAHTLLRDLSIRNPSLLLDEGLAEYLSLKVTKAYAKAEILDYLEILHWLTNQGKLEDTFADNFRWFDLRQRDPRPSYARAWSLIHFFIEGGDELFGDFFKKYLAYEKDNSVNDNRSAWKFFQENLTPEQIDTLLNKWQRFVLTLGYESI